MSQQPPPPPPRRPPPPPAFSTATPPAAPPTWGPNTPQPFPPSSVIRPRVAWYWIATVVGLVCVLIGIGLIVRTAVQWVDKIDEFQRVDVPGTEIIHLDEGSYTVYAESGFSGETSTWSFDGSVEIRDSHERMVELRRYGSRTTYDVDDHEGLALWSFRVDEAGEYRVTTEGGPGTIVAVGPGLGRGLVGGVVGGIALIVAGGLFALVTIVVIAVRRSGARRRQFNAAFRPPPP